MKKIAAVVSVLFVLTSCSLQGENQPSEPIDSQGSRQMQAPDKFVEEPPTIEEPFQYYLDERIPKEVRDLVAENRGAKFNIDNASLEAVKRDYLSYDMDHEQDQLIASQIIREPSPYPEALTTEQAESDVDFLFGYLKYGYAGYGYYGGDDIFLPLKDQILEDIKSTGEIITAPSLNEIIAEYLMPVIVDCHFNVGTERSNDHHAQKYYSANEEALYVKLEDGFHIEIDGSDYLLRSVGGAPPETYVKPILTQDGHAAWTVGVSHHEPVAPSVDVELVNTQTRDIITRSAALTVSEQTPNYTNSKEYRPYDLTEISEIPVVQCRRLWADGEHEKDLQKLVEDAAGLRDEPVVIVDLRGNSGGSSEWGDNWIEMFSGSRPAFHNIYCVMETQTISSSFGQEKTIASPGWREPLLEAAEIIPNDSFILVLTDQHVGSSAELFLAGLRQMENVIVIGTNTNGMTVFGDVRSIYLPESRLRIQCGYKLFLEPDLQFYEGVGQPPDLWAPPGEALERAILFAQNYLLSTGGN